MAYQYMACHLIGKRRPVREDRDSMKPSRLWALSMAMGNRMSVSLPTATIRAFAQRQDTPPICRILQHGQDHPAGELSRIRSELRSAWNTLAEPTPRLRIS